MSFLSRFPLRHLPLEVAQIQISPRRFHTASMAMAFLCRPWYDTKNGSTKKYLDKMHSYTSISYIIKSKIWYIVQFSSMCLRLRSSTYFSIYMLSQSECKLKTYYAFKLFFSKDIFFRTSPSLQCNGDHAKRASEELPSSSSSAGTNEGVNNKSTCLLFLTHDVFSHPRIARIISCPWSHSSIGEEWEQVKTQPAQHLLTLALKIRGSATHASPHWRLCGPAELPQSKPCW